MMSSAYRLPTYDPEWSSVGTFLRRLREAVYYTLEEASDATGFARQTIARWEADQTIPKEARGYMAYLADLNVERYGPSYRHENKLDLSQDLLEQINYAIGEDDKLRKKVREKFKDWRELKEESEAFRARRNVSQEVDDFDQDDQTFLTDRPSAPLQKPQAVPMPVIPLQRPRQVQHFTGRDREIEDILNDLKPGRVITICGPGGIGKTTLAAEIVWRLTSDNQASKEFPDGVIFHSFYNQPAVDLAFERVMNCYGVARGGASARDSAHMILQGRRALLIWDGVENCEDLEELLDVSGDCGVLMTTRQAHDDPEGNLHIIGVLPMEEAKGVLGAWSKGRTGDEAISEAICTLLGCLPLALRLAGSYIVTRNFTAPEYLELLQETPLTALHLEARQHKSVEVLLHKSVEQLDESVLQTLAVIGLLALSSFSPNAIAAALETSPPVTRSLLGILIDYGLLERAEHRYQVTHALVYTYIKQHITAPHTALVFLASYYIGLVEEQSQPGQERYHQLENERAHLMNILLACVAREEWLAVSRLVWAIGNYFTLLGYWRECVTVYESGLKAVRGLNDRVAEAAFLLNLGRTCTNIGQWDQAIVHYESALQIARSESDSFTEGRILGNLGLAHWRQKRISEAAACFLSSLEIARQISDTQSVANQLGNMGLIYTHMKQWEKVFICFIEALTIAQQIGDRERECTWLGNLGSTYSELGDLVHAEMYLLQALAIAREIHDALQEGIWLNTLGGVAREQGRIERAITYLTEALSVTQTSGDWETEGAAWANLGTAYLNQSAFEQARDCLTQAIAFARHKNYYHQESIWLVSLGSAYHGLGQVDKRTECMQQALEVARKTDDQRQDAVWYTSLATACSALGRFDEATQYYKQGLAAAEAVGNIGLQSTIFSNLAASFHQQGRVEPAIASMNEAIRLSHDVQNKWAESDRLSKLAILYGDNGQIEEAVRSLEQSLSIASDIGDKQLIGMVVNNLQTIHWPLQHSHDAVMLYNKAIAVAPDEAFLYTNLANLYIDLNDLNKAASLYQRRIELRPDDALIAYVGLGIIASHEGKDIEAKRQFNEALAVWDKVQEVRILSPFTLLEQKSLALLGIGKANEAIATQEEAICQLKPPDSYNQINFRKYELWANAPRPPKEVGKLRQLLDTFLRERSE